MYSIEEFVFFLEKPEVPICNQRMRVLVEKENPQEMDYSKQDLICNLSVNEGRNMLECITNWTLNHSQYLFMHWNQRSVVIWVWLLNVFTQAASIEALQTNDWGLMDKLKLKKENCLAVTLAAIDLTMRFRHRIITFTC